MAIIGWKRVGWSKDETKRKFELLVQFDTVEERLKFEEILEAIQRFHDLR